MLSISILSLHFRAFSRSLSCRASNNSPKVITYHINFTKKINPLSLYIYEKNKQVFSSRLPRYIIEKKLRMYELSGYQSCAKMHQPTKIILLRYTVDYKNVKIVQQFLQYV